MVKFGKILLILALFFSLSAPAYGSVSSTELIGGDAKKHSGKSIEYQGEAIGDVMERGEYGWVNLHDGDNAIGVWAPVEMLRKIKYAGDYNYAGDIVKVEGVFSQSCKEHGGDIDIHATSLSIVKAGGRVDHPIDGKKAVAAGVLAVLAAVLFAINRYQERHFIASS